MVAGTSSSAASVIAASLGSVARIWTVTSRLCALADVTSDGANELRIENRIVSRIVP
jgi:hypothetical protein